MKTIIHFQLFPASQASPAYMGILSHANPVTAGTSHMSMCWQG
jgi:hypothetical protein